MGAGSSTRPRLFQAMWNTPSSSAHSLLITCRFRNINLMSIDYALRPRLRSRLTLRRRTWRYRKPWVYGGRDYHPASRYSCLHPHSPAFHSPLQFCFNTQATLSYHAYYPKVIRIRGFGTGFNRQSFSAQDPSMSQLLRFV